MKRSVYTKLKSLFFIILIAVPLLTIFILKVYISPRAGDEKIFPRTQHPRLFVNENDIKDIKDRINNPENGLVWQKLIKVTRENIADQSFNIKNEIIKANALNYLLYKNKPSGMKAIKSFKSMEPEIKTLKKKIGDTYTLSNTAGQIMVTGSMVYDWCYSLLNSNDKKYFIESLKLLASYLETGYPNNKGSYIVGYGSENSIMLYLLSAGIAIYDEDHELFNCASDQIMNYIIPSRKFTSITGMHYQGSSYGPGRYESEMYSVILFDKIGYKNIFGTEHGKIPLQWICSLRPDGQFMRDGDIFTRIGVDSRWTFINTFLLSASYYNDPFLQQELIDEYEYKKQKGQVLMDLILQILFFNINKSKTQLSLLPLTNYFGIPIGYMIARTGWDSGIKSNSVVASFKKGEYNFNNHEHLDSGSFQIYYKGALAIDSGIYEGSSYASDHDLN